MFGRWSAHGLPQTQAEYRSSDGTPSQRAYERRQRRSSAAVHGAGSYAWSVIVYVLRNWMIQLWQVECR